MTSSKKKALSPSSLNQIHILNALAPTQGRKIPEPRQLDIDEITRLSGLADEKETQRFLFILEGHKLVSPVPEGDFTSKTWQITSHGVETLKQISTSLG